MSDNNDSDKTRVATAQDQNPILQSAARQFLPRLTLHELQTLSADQRGIVLTMKQLDPDLVGKPLKERVAELLPPELLFGDDVRTFKAIYPKLRDFLNRNGATIPKHSAHRIVRQIAKGLYDEPEEREAADKLAIDIMKGRLSNPSLVIVQPSNNRPQTELSERVAQNISMRLKDNESEFSGDTTECWVEYVDNYRQIARDYKLMDAQKLQFLHNILCKDAKRIYSNVVGPHAATFQQAVDHISLECNSPVRQSRVKNYLHGLGINSLIAKGTEVSEALSFVYKMILKLSSQCPISHRGDAHKIEFLRAAVVACDWAREPLSLVAAHQLTFQQLYGELESALKLHKEAELEMIREPATNPALPTDDRIAEINYAGQPRLRRGNPRTTKGSNQTYPLDIQGYFNCEASDHLARECPRPLNLARAAVRKLQYLNKKKRSNAVHIVLADVCQQFDEEETEENDASIFLSLVNGSSNDTNDTDDEHESDQNGDALIIESTLSINMPDGESFQGACIDSGAQLTIIGLTQAEAYCREFGGK